VRELKFRAWSIEKQSWQYFSICSIPDWVDNSEVEQFIGICDKNGKEIYEGDCDIYGAVVEWFDKLTYDSGGAEHSGFYCRKWLDYDDLSWSVGFDTFEIAGNIHQNKELLL